MRSATAATNNALTATVTEPIILVELGFTSVLRYSSRSDVTWNGLHWSGGRLAGKAPFNFRTTQTGDVVGAVNLVNNDNAISAIVLNETARGKNCKIWYLYGVAPYAVGDAQEIFNGDMDGATLADIATIELISTGARDQWTPRILFSPEFFNHMLPAGSEVAWGNYVFRFDSEKL
jgi:hypothetical protein